MKEAPEPDLREMWRVVDCSIPGNNAVTKAAARRASGIVNAKEEGDTEDATTTAAAASSKTGKRGNTLRAKAASTLGGRKRRPAKPPPPPETATLSSSSGRRMSPVSPLRPALADGVPVMPAALLCRDVAALRYYLRKGGSAELRGQDGASLLHLAARGCHAACLRVLLQARADPSATDNLGWTPLHDACAKGAPTLVVSLLADHGASPGAWNNAGWSPLHYCAHLGSTQSAVVLLRAGADPLRKGKGGESALDIALRFGRGSLAKLLEVVASCGSWRAYEATPSVGKWVRS